MSAAIGIVRVQRRRDAKIRPRICGGSVRKRRPRGKPSVRTEPRFGRSLTLPERLSDLERVQGGAFQQLIAADPERYSVVESRIRPDPADLAIIFPSDRSGIGYLFVLGSSTSSKPGNFAKTSRARSTEIGCSNSAWTAIECARKTGTRTQVIDARRVG